MGETSSNNMKGFSSARSRLVRFHLWTEKQEEKQHLLPPRGGGMLAIWTCTEEPFSRPRHSICCLSRSRTEDVQSLGLVQLSFPCFVKFTITNRKIRMPKPHNLQLVIFHFQSNSNLLGAKITYTYIMYMYAYTAIYTWKKERRNILRPEK